MDASIFKDGVIKKQAVEIVAASIGFAYDKS
jgi:hypothetical protein